MDTELCDFCKENVIWYEIENHMDEHYESGDFCDRETESRLAAEIERGR